MFFLYIQIPILRARPMFLYSQFQLYHSLLCFCLLFPQTIFVHGRVYCNSRAYGSPVSADCSAALLNLPRDSADQWFVEQQLRTNIPTSDWRPFVDGRPPAARDSIVQLPKWWSHSQSGLQYLYPGY